MFKKLLFAVAMLLVLTACTGRRETTTVCLFDELHFGDEILPGYKVVELEAIGDRINVQTERLVFDFEGEEDQLDEFIDFLEEMVAFILMATVDAITLEITAVTDTSVTLLTITDFAAMSEEELRVYLDDYNFISLELLIEELEEDGATCTVGENDSD